MGWTMHRAMHQVMLDELSNYELLGRRHTRTARIGLRRYFLFTRRRFFF